MGCLTWQSFDERRLVIASLLGETRAYDELVRRYRGAVLVVAREILGDAQLAEDAAQEALLLAFKALPQLRDLDRFGPWLYAITRRRARHLAEQGRRRRSRLDELVLAELDALRQLGERTRPWMEAAEVQQMLSHLPPEHRLVVELKYFEAMPVRRIAHFLGVPESTVKWRLHRAYQILRHAWGTEQTQSGREGSKEHVRTHH